MIDQQININERSLYQQIIYFKKVVYFLQLFNIKNKTAVPSFFTFSFSLPLIIFVKIRRGKDKREKES